MLSPSLQEIFPVMEDLCSILGYEEMQGLEEMKRKLLHANLEVERVKMEAGEELKKYKEYMKHLLGLLQIANQERDEARVQLQKLLDNLPPPNPTFNELGSSHTFSFGLQHPDNNLLPGKANSGVTESNNSHSPVESLLEVVSSPDSSSLALVNQRPNGYLHEISAGPSAIPKVDPMAGIINELAKGKSLPQKGKLLQAVQDAGPLLMNLLVAGPLPRWRNPPPLQPIRVPPVVAINGCDSAVSTSSFQPVPSLTVIAAPKRPRLAPCHDMPRANTQMGSSSMLSFMGSTGFSYNSNHPPSYSLTTGQMPMAMRQRFQ